MSHDLTAKEKLSQRLKNQIDQLRRDDESKSQSRDALSNELVATRQNVADRESQLKQLARQLQDEKTQNKNNSGHIEELKSAIDQLKRVGQEERLANARKVGYYASFLRFQTPFHTLIAAIN